MQHHRNISPDSSLSHQVEKTDRSSWFRAYPTTEPDEGLVKHEVDGAIAVITLDEYRAIQRSLRGAELSDRPAARYLAQEVA